MNEELTEEQKEELALNLFKNIHKNRLIDIYKYISKYKITIDKAIEECNQKKSKLSSMNRQFLLGIPVEILKKIYENEQQG